MTSTYHIGLFLLRFTFSAMMLSHGIPKLLNLIQGTLMKSRSNRYWTFSHNSFSCNSGGYLPTANYYWIQNTFSEHPCYYHYGSCCVYCSWRGPYRHERKSVVVFICVCCYRTFGRRQTQC